MPFGSLAAVYAWDRLGAAVTAILRQLFLLPLLRYVDDLFGIFFGPDPQSDRAYLLEIVDRSRDTQAAQARTRAG